MITASAHGKPLRGTASTGVAIGVAIAALVGALAYGATVRDHRWRRR